MSANPNRRLEFFETGAQTPTEVSESAPLPVTDGNTYDSSLTANKVLEVAPSYGRATDPVNLATDQGITDSYVVVGDEFEVAYYNQLKLWVNLTIGTSTNVKLKVMFLHTTGGDEYQEIYLGSPGSNITTVNLNVYEVASDADQKFCINIPISNNTPYCKVYVIDDADGTGTISVDYTLGYGE